MNGYEKILVAGVILLIISIIRESHTPFIHTDITTVDYVHTLLARYFHYLIFLFTTFYLLFFNGIGTLFDRYVYLFIELGICTGWYIFDCCWLSFSELLFYNPDLNAYKTTFHPFVHSIFGTYDSHVMIFSGIVGIVTVGLILYSLKSVSILYRIAYLLPFLFFYIDATLKGRVKTLYYSVKNKQLDMLKRIQHSYMNLYARVKSR
jgi:hypothetical protein